MQQLSLKSWLIRIFFILLSLFMINRFFFYSPTMVETSTSYILYPFLKIQKFFTNPIHNYYERCAHKTLLYDKLEQLQKKNEDLQADLIALQSTIDFQQCSQEVVEFAKKYQMPEKKIVQVLLRCCDATGHVIWVDKGLSAGITVDMIALYKNTIVGRVIAVDSWYSKIALITDSRCKISVYCSNTKTVGIYQGHNNSQPTLEFVPHYERLVQGDLLLSTGQGLVYPQGFAVGTIEYFDVHDVAYKVIVKPLVDVQTIEYLYLVQ